MTEQMRRELADVEADLGRTQVEAARILRSPVGGSTTAPALRALADRMDALLDRSVQLRNA